MEALNDWLNTFTYAQALWIIFGVGVMLGALEGWLIVAVTLRALR